jgi:3-hydroxy acid dehydrogenase/malonic semialdehyde reductase
MMRQDFESDVVLVTGATAGFGLAIARKFHAAGARVVAVGRRHDRLTALQSELGERLLPLALDIQDTAALAQKLSHLSKPFKNITLLVNNAGLGTDRGASQDAALVDWDDMVDINIRGLLHMTHHILPGMLARGRGQIINIGSVAGRAAGPENAVYGATKSFVLHFSKGLKSDLIGTPVRISYIAPGAAETEFSLVRWQGDTAKAAKAYAGYQALTAEDIAEAVFFTAAMPAHVDITELELMPHQQGFGPRIFARE